jgi:hypothetical protein
MLKSVPTTWQLDDDDDDNYCCYPQWWWCCYNVVLYSLLTAEMSRLFNPQFYFKFLMFIGGYNICVE